MAKLKLATVSETGARVFGVLIFASTQIQAAANKDSAPVTKDAITQAIIAQYPNTQIDSIKETPMAGIYEVAMGRNIAYTNAEGRYFLFGHLFDMQTQTDITADNKKS